MYTHFTRFTLMRSLAKSSGIQQNYVDLHSLTGVEGECFKQICQLALEKTISNKQVLHQDEVCSYFCGQINKDISLGLITVDRTAGLYGFRDIYTFLHLTFQEFLAAYHISTLSREEQSKLIEEHGHQQHMLVVWKFYCGLKLNEDQFQCILNKTEKHSLFQIQCVYESQSKIACTQLVKARNQHIQLKKIYLNITDFTAIGFIAKRSDVPFKLSILQCFNVTAINALLSEMEDKTRQSALKGLHVAMEMEVMDTETAGCIQRLLTGLEYLFVHVRKERKFNPASINYTCEKSGIKLANLTEVAIINRPSLLCLSDLSYSKLTKLNLHGSAVNETAILADGLQHCKNLTELDLGANNINAMDAQALASALTNCTRLEKFCIRDNIIANEGSRALTASLGQCPNLKILDISNNSIGHVKIELLFDNISNLTSLRVLYVDRNQISDDGAKILSLYLQQLHTLQVLDLGSNDIYSEGGMALAANLHHCSQLRLFKLQGNSIGTKAADKMMIGLKCRKIMKELNLDVTMSVPLCFGVIQQPTI